MVEEQIGTTMITILKFYQVKMVQYIQMLNNLDVNILVIIVINAQSQVMETEE